MLNVACVKVGTLYGAEYVNVLFDMVRRNLKAKTPGRFVCFTDDATGLDPAILVRPVPKELSGRGWWAKLWLFSKDAFPAGERVLYFDLDTCITGPLDGIAGYRGPFAILRDAYRPGGLQSSVMAWEHGPPMQRLYDSWASAGGPDLPGGDQEWIERMVDSPEILQTLYPGALRSFKVDCRTMIPRGTSVVFFHGHPRPHEVPTGWVPEVWKIGGGSGLEFIVQANVADEVLKRNAVGAMSRKCGWIAPQEPQERAAIIVGGGPSLSDELWKVRGMQLARDRIFAVGNTFKYLKEHGITPDAHVLLDARPENIDFVPDDPVPKYYASQCDASLLDKAGDHLICWHAHQECYREALGNHPSADVQVGGGSTVGLRAIALAYVLGYRNFRLFGFDSCYGKSHHAYPQALNDGERTLEVKVGGRTFRCAPWMVNQAEEFKELISAMVNMDCVISVYGDGMLQHVAQEMGQKLQEIDGMYWPEHDQETRQSVMWTISDVEKFVAFCKGREVAVQAGGNVGVFPKELARHFGKVYTFEPDAVNWRCLELNVTEANIIARKAALGDSPGRVAIEHNPFNPGASHTVLGDEVEVITIDSLNLTGCDLLQLDIEGYEMRALKGAEATIRAHSPVIVLEQKGLGDKYGDTDSDVTEWLSNRGYRQVAAIHRDVVYMRMH